LIRAGIAHLWFVTIHPFDDGNGRITRAITDMAIAQDEDIGRRLYSLSAQIIQERNGYYEILEKTQKQSCEITEWLKWFLQMYTRAVNRSQDTIQKALWIGKFWQKRSNAELNERQLKVIQRLIEAEPEGFEGGLTNRKYVSMTKTSRETAKRDLADLEEKGLLKRNPGKGRSVSYFLVTDHFDSKSPWHKPRI
jgi:Fic family protein